MSEKVLPPINTEQLRKMLQAFNEDLGVHENEEDRYKLGKVLTIIDATIADSEQRKAIKDLINSAWWSRNDRIKESKMSSPHTDLRGVCLALGFELYSSNPDIVPENTPFSGDTYAKQRYEKIIKQ